MLLLLFLSKLGLQPTYEGLKQAILPSVASFFLKDCSLPTRDWNNLHILFSTVFLHPWLQPTYEGLKLLESKFQVRWFDRLQPTYEGLKQSVFSWRNVVWRMLIAAYLRGIETNTPPPDQTTENEDCSLPTRDWNITNVPNSTHFISIAAYLRGIETSSTFFFNSINVFDCSLPTRDWNM